MSEWKLVPVNPTAGMIDAAYETVLTQGELLSREAYHAMLAAAPVPTAADCTSVCDAYAAENQQFSDELARLRAENEATRSALVDAAQKQKEEQSKMLAAVDRLRKESDALIAMHSALRAENERLKADAADAARYRWIKRGASFREERDMGPGGCWSIFVAVPRRPAVNSLDTAIDAAMAQGKV